MSFLFCQTQFTNRLGSMGIPETMASKIFSLFCCVKIGSKNSNNRPSSPIPVYHRKSITRTASNANSHDGKMREYDSFRSKTSILSFTEFFPDYKNRMQSGESFKKLSRSKLECGYHTNSLPPLGSYQPDLTTDRTSHIPQLKTLDYGSIKESFLYEDFSDGTCIYDKIH